MVAIILICPLDKLGILTLFKASFLTKPSTDRPFYYILTENFVKTFFEDVSIFFPVMEKIKDM